MRIIPVFANGGKLVGFTVKILEARGCFMTLEEIDAAYAEVHRMLEGWKKKGGGR